MTIRCVRCAYPPRACNGWAESLNSETCAGFSAGSGRNNSGEIPMARVRRGLWLLVLLAAWPPAARSQAAPAQNAKRDPGLYWTLETDMGNITCKLFEKEAPITVRTMVGLALGKIS